MADNSPDPVTGHPNISLTLHHFETFIFTVIKQTPFSVKSYNGISNRHEENKTVLYHHLRYGFVCVFFFQFKTFVIVVL